MNQGGVLCLFIGLLANAFLGSPIDEVQSKRLTLAGDVASIDQKIMDMDIQRSMARMKTEDDFTCKDQSATKKCEKWKKKGQCKKAAILKKCKLTCEKCEPGYCPTPVYGSDPTNYHHILGRCYYFEATPMNFTGAMDNCETIFGAPGGRLFEPRNSVVNDAVAEKGKTIANNAEGSQWIGIRTDYNLTNNNATEREFYYLSGGPFTRLPYAQWSGGEPNNGGFGDEQCVQTYTLINGTWNDIACYRYFQSICEMGYEVIWT